VTLKVAITADGKLASGSGDSHWITGPVARARGHRLRAESDAVMVGAGTVRQDDPRLTVRLPGARSPLRVVIDGRLSTRPTDRVFGRTSPGATLLTSSSNLRRTGQFERRGVSVLGLAGRGGHLPLAGVLSTLAKRGIVRLLVEGGANLHGQFIRGVLWDRLMLFVAPKLLGTQGLPWLDLPGGERMAEAIALGKFTLEELDGDVLLQAVRKRSLP
jgi:diaminohydroxyphosphoribosylaminopyrimidine deaminase/5-amino-6-(5-phosphoribosylamino)uracil reductase